MTDSLPFKIEFYEDENGRKPALEWIYHDLTLQQRRIIGLAMQEILQHRGIDVCEGEWGSSLGQGLYEFRVRRGENEILASSTWPRTVRRRAEGLIKKVKGPQERVLLRVFFHQEGDKLIVLLSGYDKGRFPSRRRQKEEIANARRNLEEWMRQQQRKKKGP